MQKFCSGFSQESKVQCEKIKYLKPFFPGHHRLFRVTTVLKHTFIKTAETICSWQHTMKNRVYYNSTKLYCSFVNMAEIDTQQNVQSSSLFNPVIRRPGFIPFLGHFYALRKMFWTIHNLWETSIIFLIWLFSTCLGTGQGLTWLCINWTLFLFT